MNLSMSVNTWKIFSSIGYIVFLLNIIYLTVSVLHLEYRYSNISCRLNDNLCKMLSVVDGATNGHLCQCNTMGNPVRSVVKKETVHCKTAQSVMWHGCENRWIVLQLNYETTQLWGSPALSHSSLLESALPSSTQVRFLGCSSSSHRKAVFYLRWKGVLPEPEGSLTYIERALLLVPHWSIQIFTV